MTEESAEQPTPNKGGRGHGKVKKKKNLAASETFPCASSPEIGKKQPITKESELDLGKIACNPEVYSGA